MVWFNKSMLNIFRIQTHQILDRIHHLQHSVKRWHYLATEGDVIRASALYLMYNVNTALEYLFPNKRSTVGLKIQSIMEWRVGDERRFRVLEHRNTFRLRKED
ncbi:hypothetical protein BDD12DRAFT_861879 [Trichophaea hybrida]|nr:hypothetical protein BDD12DRAFT_861879 [Trichophaea hybrida]